MVRMTPREPMRLAPYFYSGCATLAPAGGIDPQWAHPMALPAGIVADVVCDPDPMALSGQVLETPGATPPE